MSQNKSLDPQRTLVFKGGTVIADKHTKSKGIDISQSVRVTGNMMTADAVIDAATPLRLKATGFVAVHCWEGFIVDIGELSFPCSGTFVFAGTIEIVVRSETPKRLSYNLI